jgi:hypothetical protein
MQNDRSEETEEITEGGIEEFDKQQDIEVDTTFITQNTNTMSCWLTTARTAQQAGGMVIAILSVRAEKIVCRL